MATGSSSQRGLDSADGSESIRSVMGSIRFAFRQVDFDAVEAVLLAREQRLTRELEVKERRIDVLQLAGLEKIKLEDDLSKSRRECSALSEDLRFSKQEIMRLKSRVIGLDSDKSGAEHAIKLLKLQHEIEVSDLNYTIQIWEKRFKMLEDKVVSIMEEVEKLSGADAGMDCEVDVRREVGHGVVLEESGMDTENAAENCKQVGGDMKQEVGVGDSCSQKLVNEDRMSASSGPGLDVTGAEDVPTENAEDHRQASGNMRQEYVKKEADSCGRGEKIVSKANGDGGNGNGMAAISGNEKSIPPHIIQIDSDDEDDSCKVLGNKMAAKEHVDVEGSGQNVVGNGDGGSQDNDQDSDNDSLTGRGTVLKRQKLTQEPEKSATCMSPGTNAGGMYSTLSKLDPMSSMKQEEPRGPLFKSPMPAGKFNPDCLYESSSSSSSDAEDDDPHFEIPTCFLPNVEKAEKM